MGTEPRYRGRFAPSPTGPLHFGSLVAALASWLHARAAGGEWLVRVEDIDPPREVPGAAQQQLHALQAFGLAADAPPLWQGARIAVYAGALERLRRSGQVYECRCSRSELAPLGGRHPPACIADPVVAAGRTPALRVRVADVVVAFVDGVQGRFEQSLAREVGDFVVWRADGLPAYQLAVVVDDAAQCVTDVVRGADLLDSTPRQILLQRLLGLATPRYLHVPVVLDVHGNKLGKSQAAAPLDPADPLPALQRAWTVLGQPALRLPHSAPAEWLRAALPHFDEAAIPRRRAVGVAEGTPGPAAGQPVSRM